jgi:hypothetical protein
MTKRTALILFALTVILPFAQPRRAEAIGIDTFTTYYAGSCTNLSYNGFRWRECDGTLSQGDTQTGTWRCDDTYDCVTGEFTYYWYERCNNAWAYRYAIVGWGNNRGPTSNDCQCT